MRVLIVEDHDDVRELLRMYVTQAGHEVVGTAASVEEAVAAAMFQAPDVALLDIALQGPMLGIEGAQLLRQQYPDLRLIFVTGFSDPVVVGFAATLEPLSYLVKPVSAEQVRAVLILAEQRIAG